jgi:hypothetical protein
MKALAKPARQFPQFLIGFTVAIIVLTVANFEGRPFHRVANLDFTAVTKGHCVKTDSQTAGKHPYVLVNLAVTVIVLAITHLVRSASQRVTGLGLTR